MTLYEKWRPKSFDDVAGQEKAVGLAQRLCDQGAGGEAVWISGPKGTGKTTLARLIAETVADRWYVLEFDAGDDFRQAQVDDLRHMSQLYSLGKGGRAWIINEAHGLRAPIVRQLAGLENLPGHCVVIFTTTRKGEQKLFVDDVECGPLMARCRKIPLTNQGTAEAFAKRLQTIGEAEGLLNGQGYPGCLRIVREEKGDMRAAIQRLADGALL